MNRIRFAVIAALIAAAHLAWAGPLEDGFAARTRGDYVSALGLLLPLATQGDAGAQYGVGMMHLLGQGVAADDTDAAKWLRLSAEQGHSDAQAYLGTILEYKENGEEEALKWYRLSAAQKNAYAQHSLGELYLKGRGVVVDYAEALKWYRLASAQGHAEAQYSLGAMYANGRGVAEDNSEAVKWFRLAAAQGYANAQNYLAEMYFVGKGGIQQDYAAAAIWYRRAAVQGQEEAQSMLAKMYEEGKGVPQDYVRAYMWTDLRAKSDYGFGEDATKYRDEMAGRMTASQIARAQQMARDCQQSKFKGCE